MLDGYPYKQIIQKARLGRKAIFPYRNTQNPLSVYGGSSLKNSSDIEKIVLAPPQFTPHRLAKSIDLIFREPDYTDVDLRSVIGGFETTGPFIQASMGSPDVWNQVSLASARTFASLGLIIGIGENVASTWGYDQRIKKQQPSFVERILTYFEAEQEGIGGVVIQQNEEDATDELWNRIYSDKRFDEFIQDGRIAFEIKGGQGAKAGLGGEKLVSRPQALKMKEKYHITPDPETVECDSYERHSAPDIYTEDILFNRIKKLKNDYPRLKIWFKTGAYRDIGEVINIVANAKSDAITVDGREGGTGMSPTVVMRTLGVPRLASLNLFELKKKQFPHLSLITSGCITDGGDVVKSLALGADAVALGRPIVFSAYAYPFAEQVLSKGLLQNRLTASFLFLTSRLLGRSESYIKRYLETITLESKMLISSLGKYNIRDLGREDLRTTDLTLSKYLKIKYFLDEPSSQTENLQDVLIGSEMENQNANIPESSSV